MDRLATATPATTANAPPAVLEDKYRANAPGRQVFEAPIPGGGSTYLVKREDMTGESERAYSTWV